MPTKTALASAFLVVIHVFAQSKPTFDAASVKPRDPSIPRTGSQKHGGPGTDDPERVTYNDLTMRDLLAEMSEITWDQIAGPKWATDATGDSGSVAIKATMPKETAVEAFQLMLQYRLADRFLLVVHHESKSFPGYELTAASGGSKLKESPEDRAVPARLRGLTVRHASAFPLRSPGAMSSGTSPHIGTWGMILLSNRMSMQQFDERLEGMINESNGVALNAAVPRVVDKTGLNGVYEFTLGFAGIDILPARLPVDFTVKIPDSGESGPTLFTAPEKRTRSQTDKGERCSGQHVDRRPRRQDTHQQLVSPGM
jgi:uncharacterized protein (TIGR03435 family)